MGTFQSAVAATPHVSSEVQHVKFGVTGTREDRISVHPLLEASLGEESSSDDESMQNARQGRSSAPLTCCKMCLLFHCAFAVFAVLGASLFVLACRQGYVEQDSRFDGLSDAQFGASRSLGWWSMPTRQPWSSLQGAKSTMNMQQTRLLAGMNLSFGFALGSSAPRTMFDATMVEGVWERVPAKLRGVFRVKGQDRDELLVLHYGRWFEDISLLVVPMAPFSYAWSAGRGAASEDREDYPVEPEGAKLRSSDAILNSPAQSFAFSACPQDALCSEGHDLAYATVRAQPLERSAPGSLIGGLWIGSESLQEERSSSEGSRWSAMETWGVLNCDCVQRRKFSLEKIIDSHGEPLEPQYSDFIRTAGGDPLYFWTGWPSEEERRGAEERLSSQATASAAQI